MQDGCDEIYPAILVNILHDQEANRELYDKSTPFFGKLYGPQIQIQEKNGNLFK